MGNACDTIYHNDIFCLYEHCNVAQVRPPVFDTYSNHAYNVLYFNKNKILFFDKAEISNKHNGFLMSVKHRHFSKIDGIRYNFLLD